MPSVTSVIGHDRRCSAEFETLLAADAPLADCGSSAMQRWLVEFVLLPAHDVASSGSALPEPLKV